MGALFWIGEGFGSVGAFEFGFEFRRAADHPVLERRNALDQGKGDIVTEAQALEAIEREEKFQCFGGELGLEPIPSDVVRELAVFPANPSVDLARGILGAERGVVRVDADDSVGFAAILVVAVVNRDCLDAVAGAERADWGAVEGVVAAVVAAFHGGGRGKLVNGVSDGRVGTWGGITSIP